jgi:hypothetical protein
MCVMDHFKVKMFITKLSLLLCFLVSQEVVSVK